MLISSASEAEQPVAAPAGAKLSGSAAVEQLIGNTMTGSAEGAPYFAFYDKDGTVKMRRSGELSTGKWSLDHGELCEEYPDDDDETCYKLELDGASGVMTDDDGTAYKIDILPGNPEKL